MSVGWRAGVSAQTVFQPATPAWERSSLPWRAIGLNGLPCSVSAMIASTGKRIEGDSGSRSTLSPVSGHHPAGAKRMAAALELGDDCAGFSNERRHARPIAPSLQKNKRKCKTLAGVLHLRFNKFEPFLYAALAGARGAGAGSLAPGKGRGTLPPCHPGETEFLLPPHFSSRLSQPGYRGFRGPVCRDR